MNLTNAKQNLTMQLSSNLRYSVLEFRKYLDNCKKKILKKKIALLCRDKPPEIKYNPKFEQWYSCLRHN